MKYRTFCGALVLACVSVCAPVHTVPQKPIRVPAQIDELHEKGSEDLLNLDYEKGTRPSKGLRLCFRTIPRDR